MIAGTLELVELEEGILNDAPRCQSSKHEAPATWRGRRICCGDMILVCDAHRDYCEKRVADGVWCTYCQSEPGRIDWIPVS